MAIVEFDNNTLRSTAGIIALFVTWQYIPISWFIGFGMGIGGVLLGVLIALGVSFCRSIRDNWWKLKNAKTSHILLKTVIDLYTPTSPTPEDIVANLIWPKSTPGEIPLPNAKIPLPKEKPFEATYFSECEKTSEGTSPSEREKIFPVPPEITRIFSASTPERDYTASTPSPQDPEATETSVTGESKQEPRIIILDGPSADKVLRALEQSTSE